MTISLVYLSYSIYITVAASLVLTESYSWSYVHDPFRFNTIIRVPVQGNVSYDKWIQVITGYIVFVLFGTGVDAHNFYRKMMVFVGLGKVWPNLYKPSSNGHRTPSSFIAARLWTSSMSSKAKNLLWSSKSESTGSVVDTYDASSGNNSVVLDFIQPVYSRDTEAVPMVRNQAEIEQSAALVPPFSFKRWFARPNRRGPLLLLFNYQNITAISTADTGTSPAPVASPGVHTHAWATEDAPIGRASEGEGVLVLREVHQERHDIHDNERDSKSNYAWVDTEA
jgi:pheromone a factor receptor